MSLKYIFYHRIYFNRIDKRVCYSLLDVLEELGLVPVPVDLGVGLAAVLNIQHNHLVLLDYDVLKRVLVDDVRLDCEEKPERVTTMWDMFVKIIWQDDVLLLIRSLSGGGGGASNTISQNYSFTLPHVIL